MVNFKQFVFIATASIFCVPHGLQAMDHDISFESIEQEIVVEAPSPEIKPVLSLKQSMFNSLLKDEESQNKIPELFKRTNMPFELTYELAIQVARKASFNTITSIARELPVALYPDMGLEMLCSRNEKESRRDVLQFLLDHSPQQTIQQTEQTTEQTIELTPEHAARSNLEAMIYVSNHLPDMRSVDKEIYKRRLFLNCMLLANKHSSFLPFLVNKGIMHQKGSLELFFDTFQSDVLRTIKNLADKEEKIEFGDESQERGFARISQKDRYMGDFATCLYGILYKNILSLLTQGFQPSPEGFVFSNNQIQETEETLFEHIAKKLAFLRLKSGLNLEYVTMAVGDQILGIEINDDSNRIAGEVRQFYTGKPENDTISYLETHLQNSPFAQKLPLFGVLADVKIQTYKKLLYLLMPHCKDELPKHKEQLEQEFQMPLDELVKESEGIKK